MLALQSDVAHSYPRIVLTIMPTMCLAAIRKLALVDVTSHSILPAGTCSCCRSGLPRAGMPAWKPPPVSTSSACTTSLQVGASGSMRRQQKSPCAATWFSRHRCPAFETHVPSQEGKPCAVRAVWPLTAMLCMLLHADTTAWLLHADNCHCYVACFLNEVDYEDSRCVTAPLLQCCACAGLRFSHFRVRWRPVKCAMLMTSPSGSLCCSSSFLRRAAGQKRSRKPPSLGIVQVLEHGEAGDTHVLPRQACGHPRGSVHLAALLPAGWLGHCDWGGCRQALTAFLC